LKKTEISEFLQLLRHIDVRGIFLLPTGNSLLQLIRYVFVGGSAFVIDFSIYCLLEFLGLNYLVASVFAFVISFIFNFFVSRVFIFKNSAPEKAGAGEFTAVIIISVVGLALTEALLYIGTGCIGFDYRASKIAASVIVLFWNYFARKWFVYRKR